MARKINKPLVGALTFAGFVVMTAVGVIMVLSLRQTDPTHYVELAKKCASENDWLQAKSFYMRAANVSGDAKYYVEAGKMLDEKGDDEGAWELWVKAINQDPSLVEAHEKGIEKANQLVEMHSTPAGWLRVKKASEELLAVDQENPLGLYSLGTALLRLSEKDGGNRREGIDYIRRAVRVAPNVVKYALSMASIIHLEGRTEEAENILKRLIEVHQTPGEEAARVRYTFARYLSANNKHEDALKYFRAAEQFSGDDPEIAGNVKSQFAQYWVARWYKVVRDPALAKEAEQYYNNARKLLEESIAIYDRGFMPYMLLAELSGYQGDHLEAVKICQSRIDLGIRREGFKTFQRKFALYLTMIKAAEECLAHAATVDPGSEEYTEVLDRAEGFAVLASGEFPDQGPGLHTMGKIRVGQGREREAITLLEHARKQFGKPNWQNSRLLAQLLLRSGSPGAAESAIADAIGDDTADASCWVLYGQILLETNKDMMALQAVDEALRRSPENREALRVKMTALQRRGQVELANAIRDSYFREAPVDLYREAKALYDAGKGADAMPILESLLQNEPANITCLRLAVQILNEAKQNDKALTLVRRGMAESPDSVVLKMLETVSDPDMAPEVRYDAQMKVIEEIPSDFERNFRIAKLELQHGNRDAYVAALKLAQTALLAPESNVNQGIRQKFLREILDRRFAAAAEARDEEEMESIVQAAVKENIDGADGLSYRGRVYQVLGDHEGAISSFKLALEKQPTNADVLTLMAQSQMSVTPPRIIEASTYFTRAVEANPNLGAAQKGLAIIASVQGNPQELVRRLQYCDKLIPNDSWVQSQLLTLREKSTPVEGIQRRERIRASQPSNVENLIALADLYIRTKQIPNAVACFDDALKIPDTRINTILIAAKFFRSIGETDRALEVLQGYAKKATDPESKAKAELLLAEHWHVQGDMKRAEAALQRAASHGEFLEVCAAFATFKTDARDFEAALEWYDRAINLADQKSTQIAIQFRRRKIDLFFRTHQKELAQQAVEDFERRYPEDPNVMLLNSAVSIVSGRVDDAIEHLSRYLDRHPDDLNATLQRARLYGSQGRWPIAIRELERIRSVDPKFQNYESRLLLADGYALVHNLELAFQGLESILRDDPSAIKVAKHLVAMYQVHDRYTDAIRIVTSMANRYKDNPYWVTQRGELKMKVGDAASAIVDYEKAAKLSGYDSDQVASLLGAYITLKQYDRGLTYYKEVVPEDKINTIIQARYAELLAHTGQLELAVPLFLKAFRDSGFGTLRPLEEIGVAVIRSCDKEESVGLFSEKLDDPTLERAQRHILAILRAHFEQDSEAIALMQGIIETSNIDAEKIYILARLGNVYERQEDYENARQTYEALLEISDTNIIGLNNLAFLLSDKMDRPRDALAYAQRAAQVHGHPTVKDTLAWTHVKLGEYPEAIALLTKLLEKERQYVPAIYHLAEAYRRSGDLDKAKSLLEGAENLIKEGVGTHYRPLIQRAMQDVRRGDTAP